jgi:hypothetical protein
MQPLTFTGLPLSFSGFTNINTPKGKDGFGNKTKTEVLSYNRINWNVGSLVGRKDAVQIFAGYKYWHNKFGNDSKNPLNTGAVEKTFVAGLEWHLP